MASVDMFDIIWSAIFPYLIALLQLAFGMTIFSLAIKTIRQRSGASVGSANPWGDIWAAFLGYLLGRGIPIIIGLADVICDDILSRL